MELSQKLYKDELETLKQYKKDLQWFKTHLQEFRTKYKDKYIAIHKERIVGKGEDYRKLIRKLKKDNTDTTSFVIKLVRGRPISFIL